MAVNPRALYATLLGLALATGVTGGLGAPLVPAVAEHQDVSLATAQWIVIGPFLSGAVAAPIVGRLGVGRRRKPIVVAALALATLGTLVAALPLGIVAMIAGRTMQGFAFAITPLLFAFARDHLPQETLRRAMGTLSVANVAAAALGFPLTAAVVHVWGIPAGFWFGTALMLSTLAVAVVMLPGSTLRVDGRVDIFGATLLAAGFLLLLLVISRGHEWGYGSVLSVGCLTSSIALLAACYVWFRTAEDPMVDLTMATSPGVFGLHVGGLLAGVGAYVLLGSVMVLVQAHPGTGYGLGLSVVAAGAMLVPYAIGSIAGSQLALMLGERASPTAILPLGCVVFGLSNAALAVWHQTSWQVVVAMVVGGIGSGFTFNSIPWLMLHLVPVGETSRAMGLNVILRFVGFALGSAVSTAVIEGIGGPSGDGTSRPFAIALATGSLVAFAAAAVSVTMLRAAHSVRPD